MFSSLARQLFLTIDPSFFFYIRGYEVMTRHPNVEQHRNSKYKPPLVLKNSHPEAKYK